jgi:hypothetical protein
MEKEYIVIIVLLCVLILCFLAIVIGIVVAAAKVHQVTQPIRTIVRGVRKVKKTGSKLRKGLSKLRNVARDMAPKIRSSIQKDLKKLRHSLKQKRSSIRATIPMLITRGLNILSGEPCAKFEQLWSNHINWTYYYGLLTLSSRSPMTVEQQEKANVAATHLFGIQDDLSKLMSSCVAADKQDLLNQLFRDHIAIVAQIAARWKQQPGPFDATLVQSWFKNATDTVNLLESQSGVKVPELRKEYTDHLNMTAAYLSAIAAGQPQKANELFVQAFDHVPNLATVFCNQRQKCM